MLGFDLLLLTAVSLCAAIVARRVHSEAVRPARAYALHRDAAAGAPPMMEAGGGSGVAGDAGSVEFAAIMADEKALLKRALDIVLSIALVTFLAPLLVLTALAIKLESPGPIFYRQQRIGLGGREFALLKFRSMVVNAEPNGPQYAATNDARVTRVGRLIRKCRIDEIPQTFNVLRGEMSFVGPRPERPEFVTELEREIPLYHCRHLVKPGITGLAQVSHEYTASVDGARRKLHYDLHYIRHFSLALDLLIVLLTVRVALFGLGSR